MPKFSAKHRLSACNCLAIEPTDFEEAAKSAHKKVLSRNPEATKWRTLAGYLCEHKKLTTSKTVDSLLSVLWEMGMTEASTGWLNSNGATPPEKGTTIPQSVVSSIDLELSEQRSVGSAHTGLLHVYRHHGNQEGKVIRELLYITGGEDLNQEVLYVNHRGAVYRGYIYRKMTILYVYLFRRHERFKFVSRTLMLSIEATGMIQACSGVMVRIRKTGALPISSDIVAVPAKEVKDTFVEMIRDAFEAVEPIDLSKAPDGLKPMEFIEIEDQSTRDQALISLLRPPTAGLSQERVTAVLNR